MNRPSVTSQAVALTRARLDRPHSPDGDPNAQRLLCADMRFDPPAWLETSIAARTRFVDAQVEGAIATGIRQIVICGAGYDDRALRFRTAGVRFFELDHPATQADKARLLDTIGAIGTIGAVDGAEPDVTLVGVDFRSGDVAAALASGGHRASEPTLFVAEGLLVYLDQPVCTRLLATLAGCAAPGSFLAASLATHAGGLDSAQVVAAANDRRRTGAAEPWRTILPADEHLALLTTAGWQVSATQWSPFAAADVTHDRRSLLVVARI